MDLRDKIVLVTGSSRGIGRATAKAFADKGAMVVIHYNARKEEAEKVRKECKAGLCVQADLSKLEDCKKLVDAVVAEFGRIDVLVNNAGINPPSLTGETTLERWDELVNVNLRAPFFLSQYAVPHMHEGGVIINTASIRAFKPRNTMSVYGLTKAGVDYLTKSLAHDLAPRIRVNAVAPGYIDTDMLARFPEEKIREFKESTALGRLGKPEEIASAIVFLAEHDYVTGHTLVVDGGFLVK